MIELNEVALGPIIEGHFDEMVIPGDGNGIAVAKEEGQDRCYVGIGSTSEGGVAVRYVGEPYRRVASRQLSTIEFSSLLALASGKFKRNGIIFADILDGVSYSVKGFDRGDVIRFFLCNPDHIESHEIKEFASRLDTLLGCVGKQRKVWRRRHH